MPRISARAYAALTAWVTWAVGLIIVTGGAVRLTGSGLGCPDWPTCAEGRLVAEVEYHQMVEFVNRTVTGLVSVAVILAVLGALARAPRRRDLTWLALGLVGGVIGQIVLGGLTVLYDLNPALVMGHFLLSLVLLTFAVVLHHRANQPHTAPVPAVPRELIGLGRVLLAAATVVVVTGGVVTGSGPHGGDETAHRFDVLPTDAARVHGISVMLFLGLAIASVVLIRRAGGAPDAIRRGVVLLAVIVAQAAVGYTQYFTGVPPLLVGIHIAGAAAVWTAVVRFNLGLHQRPSLSPSGPERIAAWEPPPQSSSNDPAPSRKPARTFDPTGLG